MKKQQTTKWLSALLWTVVLTLMPMCLMADDNTPLSVTAVNEGGGIGDQYGGKAFDGNLETKWCGDISTVVLPFVEVELAEPSKLDYYYLYTGNDINYENSEGKQQRNPKEWKLYAKVNESDEWTLISHVTDAQLPAVVLTRSENYKIDAEYQNIEYNYFRFEILQIEQGNIYEVSEICLINCAHVYPEGSAICSICGSPCAHLHLGELIAPKEPTCAEAGNVAYHQCPDCHKYFDAEGNELVEGAWVIPTVEHSYENGVCVYSYTSECSTPYQKPEGEGTEQSPYLIGTAGNLAWYRNLTRNGAQNIHARMTADIDMTAVCNETIGSWRGIDNYVGTFDGDGHVLTNLYINTSDDRVGLFHQNTGVIKNLGIESGIVKTSGNVVGPICAENIKFDGKIGRIFNCFNKVDVESSYRKNMTPSAGGICGENEGYVEKCYNTGNVSGLNYIGGICGKMTQGTIADCYNTGNISGEWSQIGGICGYANNYANANLPTIVKNCYNIGNATTSTAGRIAKAIIGERSTGGKNNFSFTNNYYLEGLNADEYGTAMTEEQFADGVVAWALNGSMDGEGNFTPGKTDGTQAWYQKLGDDGYPVLTPAEGNTVYFGYENCLSVGANFSNSPLYAENEVGHVWEDGICDVCDEYQKPEGEGTEQNPYLIANRGNILWFDDCFEDAYLKLVDDVTLMESIKVFSEYTLTMNLNGHALIGSKEDAILVLDGGTLNLRDAESNAGKLTKSGLAVNVNVGTFNMYGGSITGCYGLVGAAVNVYNGTFNMYGGAITENNASSQMFDGAKFRGVVHVDSKNGYFNMYGGSITNNEGQTHGVGVYCVAEADGSGDEDADGCLAAGTMVTMADGSKKAIEDVAIGESVLTMNHDTGKMTAETVFFVHKTEMDDAFTLHFSNGTDVTVVKYHSFFEKADNRYVTLNPQNASSYVGRSFYCAESSEWVELTAVTPVEGTVGTYALLVAHTQNHLANGMLSAILPTFPVYNAFEFGDNLTIDPAKKAADIALYGTMDYAEVEDAVSPEFFDAVNGQYATVLFGKGMANLEDCLRLAAAFLPQNNARLRAPRRAAEVKQYHVTLSGKVNISGNMKTDDNTPSNLAVSEGMLSIGTLEAGSEIGIDLCISDKDENGQPVTNRVNGIVASDAEEGDLQYFTTDNPVATITYRDGQLELRHYPVGDVNMDGSVNVGDVITLINILEGLAPDTGNADIDGQDGVNQDDVVLLRKMILRN